MHVAEPAAASAAVQRRAPPGCVGDALQALALLRRPAQGLRLVDGAAAGLLARHLVLRLFFLSFATNHPP
ncbi:hypothetical protein [Streptomyces sp. KN37]|uniref:hypothetical protein n=1 Tax=Streptomyces sp. KN37 TaxID=3090667 RepID=UPI002A74BD96|nr:hypothetical protein [Streptomyces sp. KN37]WPO75418.1 hypothetical protein R9806_34900 [Streptomyces sp. KN37]